MKYHNYIFIESNSLLHTLPKRLHTSYNKEFLETLESDKHVVVYTYATLGLKSHTNILIWFQSDTLESIQNLLNTLTHTRLGQYLTITHTLFGITRQTQYSAHSTGHVDTSRKGGKYLIIYPFTKSQKWYALDFDTRRKLMGGHVGIGKKHSETITQILLYSYGVDDSEFIVSYETNDLSDFQTLVMELRQDKVREYTLKDTPIFTCVYKTPIEALTFL